MRNSSIFSWGPLAMVGLFVVGFFYGLAHNFGVHEVRTHASPPTPSPRRQ
jgi:hypothetical protein